VSNPRSAIWPALAAAALFGASTPLVKLLVGELPTLLLAGLLYLGSGLGLAAIRLLRDRGWKPSGLANGEWRWLAGAIVFGGLLGPVLLVFGLTHTDAGAASLMLNLEAVLTAVLAWVIFKENADRRIVLGMLLIVAGGAVLVWPGANNESPDWIGPLAIAAACLCWAHRQQPDAPGFRLGRPVHCRGKGLDGRRRQHQPRLVIGGICAGLAYRRCAQYTNICSAAYRSLASLIRSVRLGTAAD
jgi:drug/metabolite transporter (DMT)-like permease